ncbi:hypothetical protein SLEP1_g2345 [Rubroshorea leprosula]|uniref:F-box associated beta-propeller type 1 domain-containing protein n=1 Tax=Rubroshorea leprosula TaxID=152421 RepID=A0AAV5HQK4_9ROSI|nr:hypothetical protein SLEP1_g2345 [Rubroshorea leprosula]
MDLEFLVLRIPSDLNDCEGDVLHAVETQAPQKIETYLIQQSAKCDGMLGIPKGCSVLVWNPSTKVTRRIPKPPKPDRIDGIGFGYDCTTDDYKVVNIMRPRENKPTRIQSVRLRTGLWNTAQNHGMPPDQLKWYQGHSRNPLNQEESYRAKSSNPGEASPTGNIYAIGPRLPSPTLNKKAYLFARVPRGAVPELNVSFVFPSVGGAFPRFELATSLKRP